jgi:adenylosuccinate synthase
MRILAECQATYTAFDGWEDLPPEEWRKIAAKGSRSLPKEARAYVTWIVKELGTKLAFVSVGRGREDTIDLRRSRR